MEITIEALRIELARVIRTRGVRRSETYRDDRTPHPHAEGRRPRSAAASRYEPADPYDLEALLADLQADQTRGRRILDDPAALLGAASVHHQEYRPDAAYEALLRDHEEHIGREGDVSVIPAGVTMILGDDPVPGIDLPGTQTRDPDEEDWEYHDDTRPDADAMLTRLGWRRTGVWVRVPGTDDYRAPVVRDA